MINFSEILWNPGRPKAHPRRPLPIAVADEPRNEAARHAIPTEKAYLQPDDRLALLTDSSSASADRFRFLKMRLLELRGLTKLQTLVITSPLPEDGKSTLATCLATALADGGKRSTLLIESDLHHPTVATSLGLSRIAGLAEALEDGGDPMRHVRKIEPLGWYLLQAGTPQRNPTELLQSDAFGDVLRNLAPHFDWILIDTPPALPLTDALVLSRQADATLLVARANRTPSKAIEDTIERIGRKHVLGILLNCSDGLTRLYSQYYGRYGNK